MKHLINPVIDDARLSERELQVIRLIASGDLDKEIALKLQMSIHTVTTHNRNIRRKTGSMRKTDITRYAHQQNLV